MRARTTSAIAAVLSLAACTDGGAPLTSGERLLAARDLTDAWFWRPRSLAYGRMAASGATAEDLWVRELDEAEPRLALSDLGWTTSGHWPIVRIGNLLATGNAVTVAYDVDTHTRQTFYQGPVVLSPDGRALAHWMDPTIPVATSDAIVAIGPLDGQRGVPGFAVRAAAFMGDDLAALGHRAEDPQGAQVLARLSPADFSTHVLVSGLPAWDPAQYDAVVSSCLDLTTDMCRLFQVLGCTAETPACPETGEIPCAIVYTRDVPGTSPALLAPVAYDVNNAMEVPLDGNVPPLSRLFRSPDGRRVAWTETNALHVWDACSRRALRCEGGIDLEGAIMPGDWRPDSAVLAMVSVRKGLLVMSAEDGTCSSPATVAPAFSFFSRDSTRMGWVDEPVAGPDRTLWIADGLGGSPVALASGYIVDAAFSADTRTLVIRRLHDGTGSIGVLDLTAATPAERPIAASTSFTMALGARRLIAMTGWSNQDQSGRVELFDLLLGTSAVLAESATTLSVAGSVDGAADVAYVVRARVPSASDGLWLMTLPAAGAP